MSTQNGNSKTTGARWMSMTGYAQTEWTHESRHFKFQAKSVNHRFFEFRMRAPRDWQMLETNMKNWCKAKLERGSVDFWIEEVPRSRNESDKGADHAKVQNMFLRLNDALKASRESSAWGRGWMPEAVRALILSRMPDLWMEPSHSNMGDMPLPEEAEIKKLVEEVCDKLVEARGTEGEGTRKVVASYTQHIRELWIKVSNEIPAIREGWKTNLEERLNKLSESFAGGVLDSQRIYQEFVMLADKRDVAEEIQRIDIHLKALDQHIEAPTENAIGKKLDFFMQELNREWTTLSNKIQNAELNQSVGEAKMTIEKIREQSLNLV